MGRAEAAALDADHQAKRVAYQEELDRLWGRLLDNDPDLVLAVLAKAFEDNEAAAAPVGVDGGEGSVVVLVPPVAAVPERKPTLTQAGNLSLKKLTKAETADFYKLMVCGFVLATVKEAFAVAPGLAAVRIVAVRSAGLDAYGRPRAEALLAARFARADLEGVAWATVDAGTIVNDTSTQLVTHQTGPSKALAALDLADEPDIAKVIAAVDLSELTS